MNMTDAVPNTAAANSNAAEPNVRKGEPTPPAADAAVRQNNTEPTVVTIDWETARQANLGNWDDRVPLHEVAYGLDAFDDPAYVSGQVRHDLARLLAHLRPDASSQAPARTLVEVADPASDKPLAGVDLLHLQCHIGTDTVSLARCGATVTGLDFSAPALQVAERLAARDDLVADWVCGDVLDADAVLREAGHCDGFDVVYTSMGTIVWLADLDRWARQIAALLRPGGVFLIMDAHPMLLTLDESDPNLRVAYRYFGDGRAQTFDDASTYIGEADLGGSTHTRTYEWPHPISEIIGALLANRLRLERFDEGHDLGWQFSPLMEQQPSGLWRWPAELRLKVPSNYTIVARRPDES